MARRRTFRVAAVALMTLAIAACADGVPLHLAAPPGTDPDALQVNSYQVNHGHQYVWVTFQDKDYTSLGPIIPLMEAEFQRQAHEAPPAAVPLGGKVKIALSTFRQGPHFMTITFDDPDKNTLAERANQEFALAVARGRVEAIKTSKLFDSVTVETADVGDVAIDGYDVVLWTPASTPGVWRYRIAGKSDAYVLKIPPKSKVAQFADVVGDAVRQSKAAH